MQESLTEAQLKRRERNRRYQEKLKTRKKIEKRSKIFPDTPTALTGSHTKPNEGKKTLPYLKISPIIILAITSLLIYFQTDVFIKDKINFWLSFSIAVTIEASLCYLSLSLKNKISAVLFFSLFFYSLGTMSYSLLIFSQEMSIKSDAYVMSREIFLKNIEQTRKSLEISQEKKDLHSSIRFTKILENQIHDLNSLTPILNKKWFDFQSYWFILLRAILMLLNSVLIHRLWGKNERN